MKTANLMIAACTASVLTAPVVADSVGVPTVQTGAPRPTIIGDAWVPVRPSVDAGVPLVDLAVEYGGQASDGGSEGPLVVGGEVDPAMITQLGGLTGGSNGGLPGTHNGSGSGMVGTQGGGSPIDPTGHPLPLPGPAAMTLAGLIGVAATNGRRRR